MAFGVSKSQSASLELSENTGDLTPQERQRINRKLGASIDANLGTSIKDAFGLHLDASKLVSLTGALTSSVRSKLSSSLGITKELGVGATASAGTSLGGAGGVQGGVSLGDTLRLGGGINAGNEGTPLAGVKLASGVDPKGIPGLTSGITVLEPESAEVQVSASRQITDALNGLIDDALASVGLPKQKQELVKVEVSGNLGKALEDAFRSCFGPHPEFAHARGHRILAAKVHMQRSREWTALVSIDQLDIEEEPPTGPFSFVIENIEFRCSILPGRSGRSQGGRTTLRVVGGAGGLAHSLEVKNYGSGTTTVKSIVADIMRDSGETLSADSDKTILAKRIESWQRVAGPGRMALDRILGKVGATWRILRDGTVWIGVDTWPEVEPDGTVLDDDWADGSIELAPDTPTMVPGIVVRGQRIEEVVHKLGPSGLRTTLHATSARSLFDQALEPIRHETEYHKRYDCRVVRQNADKTVDVIVDDDRMRGRGVARCRIRTGLPGTTIEASAGARCLVGWSNGDPALPFVSDWEMDTAFVSISIGGPNGRGVACVGDLVDCYLSPGTPIAGAIGTPPSTQPFVGTLTVLTPVKGIISSARAKVKGADS